MHEEPPVSITAHRYGDPMQQAPADSLTTKHDGRYLVPLVDLLNPLIHEQTIAVTSDSGLPSSWATGFSSRALRSSFTQEDGTASLRPPLVFRGRYGGRRPCPLSPSCPATSREHRAGLRTVGPLHPHRIAP